MHNIRAIWVKILAILCVICSLQLNNIKKKLLPDSSYLETSHPITTGSLKNHTIVYNLLPPPPSPPPLPPGTQTYTRLDTESSVARKEGEELSPQCRCGWPQNMMLPLGTPEGMEFVAFAMLTKGQLMVKP